MSRPYSRDYECELLTRLREAGISDGDLVTEMLSYFNSDDTCAALESACDAFDVPYDEE